MVFCRNWYQVAAEQFGCSGHSPQPSLCRAGRACVSCSSCRACRERRPRQKTRSGCWRLMGRRTSTSSGCQFILDPLKFLKARRYERRPVAAAQWGALTPLCGHGRQAPQVDSAAVGGAAPCRADTRRNPSRPGPPLRAIGVPRSAGGSRAPSARPRTSPSSRGGSSRACRRRSRRAGSRGGGGGSRCPRSWPARGRATAGAAGAAGAAAAAAAAATRRTASRWAIWGPRDPRRRRPSPHGSPRQSLRSAPAAPALLRSRRMAGS